MEGSQKTVDEAESRSKQPPVVDLEDKEDEEVEETKGGGHRKSWVWEYFDLEAVKKGGKRQKCPFCPTWFVTKVKKNGTSAMGSHLKKVCVKSPVYDPTGKKGAGKNQSTLNYKKSGESGSSTLEVHSFNQEKCRKSLARMCIKDNQPFSIVEDEGFREYSWDLCPRFVLPSRWTVARDCLEIYKVELEKLKDVLRNYTVSLTTDTWTSIQNINYSCLTAHWVSDEGRLEKRIINFCPIANHKGVTIGKLVYKCLQKWGIKKVFTVTVDNASSNDGAIKYLVAMLKGPGSFADCKYLHLRCAAHIINLVVRDGLDENFSSIEKIRNAVKYVRSSASRAAAFQDCVEKEQIKCSKKPSLDVDTRWNSTFLMLETAEKYEAAFDRLHAIDSGFKTFCGGDVVEDTSETTSTRKKRRAERVVGAPDADDWEVARYFIDYLRIFYNVTKKIYGSKYVTANLFFSELVTMQASITRMCQSTDVKKKRMALSMKQKYDKYWDNIDNMNFLLHVAVVLDPRNKIFYLEYCLELIHGYNSEKTKAILELVNKTLLEVFEHFKKNTEKEKSDQTKGTSSSPPTYFDPRVNLEVDFAKFMEQRGQGVNKTELEVYLSDGMEKRDDDFVILHWWKLNSAKFPVLSQVAKLVLGMPISTVSSESAFSVGGRVIDATRSSLTHVTAEALICTQDWIRNTPVDIQFKHMTAAVVEEQREILAKLELETLGNGEDLSMDED